MSLLELLLVLLGGFLLILWLAPFLLQTSPAGPPGPRPLPVLGNLLQLATKRPDKTLQQLSKTYGPVFTVYLGSKPAVVLAGYDTVKEALVHHKEEFGERDPPAVIQEANLHYGVAFGNGDTWKVLRRFALTNLRDFGMGKKSSEEKIIEECRHLVQQFQSFKGEAFDPSRAVTFAVCNVVCSMIYGRRFPYDAPEFVYIVNQTIRGHQLLSSAAVQLYNIFPAISRIFSSAPAEIARTFAANKSHHRKLLEGLKLRPPAGGCIAEAFLQQKQQLEDSGTTNGHFNDENLLVTIMNLFSAGTETTATTLQWGLLFMAKHPHIQDQVRAELHRVTGGRQVRAEDRPNLPFANAVVHETQRAANILPMSLFHRTSRDVTFRGHFIKKGTTVIPLLTSVLHDESQWEKPDGFHPAHFLHSDGKFRRCEAFLPFSAGFRACPGENLARMELFLFFCTLLQRFRFTPPPGTSDLDLSPKAGLSLHAPPHALCAVPLM